MLDESADISYIRLGVGKRQFMSNKWPIFPVRCIDVDQFFIFTQFYEYFRINNSFYRFNDCWCPLIYRPPNHHHWRLPLKNSTSSSTHSSSFQALNGIFQRRMESNKYRSGFLGIENRKLEQTCSPFDRHSTHYSNIGDSVWYSPHACTANDDGFVTSCPNCFSIFIWTFD